MNDIAASVGLAQIKHVDKLLNKCHENGRRYNEKLANEKNINILTRNKSDFQTYWGYTILVNNRKKVSEYLLNSGIESAQIHVRNYIYSMFKKKRKLPNVDWFDEKELAIPCGWWVDRKIQDYIIKKVKEAVS